MDFAWFAVNLGYTLSDYEALTPRQKMLILKAWESKRVQDDVHLNAAIINAIYNANRPKNRKYKPLWKKKAQRIATNKEEMQDAIKIVKQMEITQGKDWVKKIYQANMGGM